jgi:guanidinopropionase
MNNKSDEHGSIAPMPRYAGVATFMRTPLVDTLDDVDIAMIGVPFDGGVTNRPGARHGPRELRNQSTQVKLIHPRTRVNPFELCRIGDLGDVVLPNLFDLEDNIDQIFRFFEKVRESGTVPLTAGGDHCISYPILKALGANEPLSVVHIDAHTDTWDSFGGSKYMHGTPFRRAVEDGVIDPQRTVQVGIRGSQTALDSWDYSLSSGMRVIFMDDVDDLGLDKVIEEIRSVVGDRPTYLSFDIDAMDPAYAPGTGTPECGGFTTREAIKILRGLRGLQFVGADLVEVSPPLDPGSHTTLLGVTLMFEILCLLAEQVKNSQDCTS